MTPYQKAELSSRIELAISKAADAAHNQHWQEFDQHMAKVSELRASLPIHDARTIATAILQDTTNNSITTVRIGIEKDRLGLIIHPEGTGTYDGPYAPILIEQHEGTLMLVVWADINQQEPTHLIDLSTAMESCRINTD